MIRHFKWYVKWWVFHHALVLRIWECSFVQKGGTTHRCPIIYTSTNLWQPKWQQMAIKVWVQASPTKNRVQLLLVSCRSIGNHLGLRPPTWRVKTKRTWKFGLARHSKLCESTTFLLLHQYCPKVHLLSQAYYPLKEQ